MDEEKNTYYALTVNCLVDNVDTTFYFDYVSENSVNSTIEITNHPLVSGDMIADHQYINPKTASFSGTFSLYGNKKGYSILYSKGKPVDDVLNNSKMDRFKSNNYVDTDTIESRSYGTTYNDRLAYIEDIFEKIQKDGIHCNLVKMSLNRDSSRFKVRKNMILTSITWTEHQFSVDFDFGFTEALTAEVPVEDEYFVDDTDEDLPLLTEPVQRSAINELLDKTETTKQIIYMLQNEDLIKADFLNALDYARFAGQSYLIGMAVGAAVGIVALQVIAGVCGGLSAAVPVGTIIAAAIAVTAATIAGIWAFVRKCKKGAKYNVKEFRHYKKMSKQQEEEDRFFKFIADTISTLDVLDDHLTLLEFDADIQQQCLVTIDNILYAFTFKRATENSVYSLSVDKLDEEGNTINERQITNIYESSVSSLYSCNESTLLFSIKETNTQVYLCNLLAAKQAIEMNEQGDIIVTNEKEMYDLRNYGILICTVDMNNFNDLVNDVIKENIFKR